MAGLNINLDIAGLIAAAVAAEMEKHFKVEPTLTLAEAAQEIGISVQSMRALCRDRKIPAIRLEKSYRIRVVDLNRFLEERTVQALPNSPHAPRADMEIGGGAA